jgi:hypothetical protein
MLHLAVGSCVQIFSPMPPVTRASSQGYDGAAGLASVYVFLTSRHCFLNS